MKTRYLYSLLFVALLSLSACTKTPKEVTFNITPLSEEISIHTNEQINFINSSDPDALVRSDPAKYSKRKLDIPKTYTLSYEESNDVGVSPINTVAEFSTSSEFTDSLEFTTSNGKATIGSLKLNTKYYYRIKSTYKKKTFTSDVYEVKVNDNTPNNLYIPGVVNSRDVGGWRLDDGHIYKQGLLYRTAQFNYGGGLNTFVSTPDEEGLNILNNVLKIKTDIDLRKTLAVNHEDEVNGISSSPLGDDVNYVSLPMVFGSRNIFTQDVNFDSIRGFFDTLSDINNYPIAFHCVRGTDRTGALAYVLGALVGMNEEQLRLDYTFSNLAQINNPVYYETICGDDFYVKGINDCSGSTLSEKAKNYLVDTCGVSSSKIDQVINILRD